MTWRKKRPRVAPRPRFQAKVDGSGQAGLLHHFGGVVLDHFLDAFADGEAMEARILGLAAQGSGCRVSVEGGMNRPPFAETPAIAALYEQAPLRAVLEASAQALPEVFAARRAKLK